MKVLDKLTNNVENKLYKPYMINNSDLEIKLVNFQKNKNKFLLQVELDIMGNDNYRLLIKGNYLTLIVTEKKEISRPIYIHNINWRLFDNSEYEVMKSVDFLLPGNNFYLVRHFFVPADKILNIYLARIHYN
jgi:hypothetical protein